MRAKKSFGQHFLHDQNVLHRIVDALEVQAEEYMVEVGPGTGQLTRVVSERYGHKKLICVERDRDMVAHLALKFPEIHVLEADAMRYPWNTLIPEKEHGQAIIFGNLPYNVSTQIYFHLLFEHRAIFKSMVFMFQKEVASRLLSDHGSKSYGPPSVMTHLLTRCSLVTNVAPSAFRPPPKVKSAVIKIQPLPQPRYGLTDEDIPSVNPFIHALFRQRRKTLRNNLKAVAGPHTEDILETCQLDGNVRAETLSPQTLVQLWRSMYGTSS